MRFVAFLLAAAVGLGAQTTASILGKVVDAKTSKTIPAAWVSASRTAVPPLSKRVKSGGDGSFQITGLTAGTYSVCVQVAGEQYLDPCQWGAVPTNLTVAAAQAVIGVSIRLTAASALSIQVVDPPQALSQLTADGRHPDLTLGVWGPHGIFYPAHPSGKGMAAPGGATTYTYRLAMPLDTSVNLFIASHDLKLGDGNGLALPSNASTTAFQHATGDANPRSFAFTVLGMGPG